MADVFCKLVPGHVDVVVAERFDSFVLRDVQFEPVDGDDLGRVDGVPVGVGHDADHDVVDRVGADCPRAGPVFCELPNFAGDRLGCEEPDLCAWQERFPVLMVLSALASHS